MSTNKEVWTRMRLLLALVVTVLALFSGWTPVSADQLGTQWEVCEGGNLISCIGGTWTRQGSSDTWNARWSNGAVATLTITGSGNSVTVERGDPAGVSRGLRATYKGTISDDGSRIQGTVDWCCDGLGNRSGVWRASIIGATPPEPPSPPEPAEPVAPPAESPAPEPEATSDGAGDQVTSQDKYGGYQDIVEASAAEQGVDPRIIAAIIKQSSGFDANASDASGGRGLMLLPPDLARSLGVDDPSDPAQNVKAGTRYFAQLLERYGGNVEMALAAWNAGPGTVDRHGGIPPFRETQDFVRQVLEYAAE
ncbi:MAG: lytic transglycosylase domain-containing protein [Chloroflexi bacterium]|nr:lytic transglycosylase domain-containing protein [Chloroflexota bacterium]